ncbi:thiol-disulfide oxidoreductase DCC family protein [Nibrella saemangeumensis]|uniref:Thiol-disulfide oxidoreductase DCC family protein n=1 Tax=Nibrella saemangeumensis TaxID=1084526 RepID=A0ABP8MRL3_9BACT
MDIVLFDGVCNLCNGAVNFIIDHDPQHRFRYASLQSETGKQLVARHPELAGMDSIVLLSGDQVLSKSGAVLRIASLLSGPWRWLAVFRIVPQSLRDIVYDWVARNRYRLFGRTDACRIPTPELRDLFLE